MLPQSQRAPANQSNPRCVPRGVSGGPKRPPILTRSALRVSPLASALAPRFVVTFSFDNRPRQPAHDRGRRGRREGEGRENGGRKRGKKGEDDGWRERVEEGRTKGGNGGGEGVLI